MKDSKKQLIYDTVAFLKQEGLLNTRKKITSPKSDAPLPTKKLKIEPLPASNAVIIEKKNPPKIEALPQLLIDSIKKHLPHLKLIEKIPKMQRVLITYDDEKELPFLKNLKKAIEERFCLCDLKKEPPVKLDSFTCVLSEKNLNHPHLIPLDKAAIYRENIEKKRALWNQICQILSPKSS